MKCYRVANWDENFENHETRKRARGMPYVLVPTKHDGLTFSRLMSEPDGTALFGAWVLILQVAAKCPQRGVLATEDGPLTAQDIAVKTRSDPAVIIRAQDVLSSPAIRWICRDLPQARQKPAGNGKNRQAGGKNRQATAKTGSGAGATKPNVTKPNETETERNGTELNETEQDREINSRDHSDSDSGKPVSRVRLMLDYHNATEPLFGTTGNGRGRQIEGNPQYEADTTCAKRWWHELIWPDGEERPRMNPDEVIRWARQAKSKTRPMAWLTARIEGKK